MVLVGRQPSWQETASAPRKPGSGFSPSGRWCTSAAWLMWPSRITVTLWTLSSRWTCPLPGRNHDLDQCSTLKSFGQELVGQFGIRLALGFLHELTHKEALHLGLAIAELLHLLGVGCQ